MRWRRGIVRVWVVLAVLWWGLFLAAELVGGQIVNGFDSAEYLITVVMFPLAAFVVLYGGAWAVEGFLKKPNERPR